MIDKSEKKNLLWDLLWLSIKEYIAKQPPTYLGLNYDGLPLEGEYTIDDFVSDFNIKKSTIRRCGRSGVIPMKFKTMLIKKGVLPDNWDMLQ